MSAGRGTIEDDDSRGIALALLIEVVVLVAFGLMLRAIGPVQLAPYDVSKGCERSVQACDAPG